MNIKDHETLAKKTDFMKKMETPNLNFYNNTNQNSYA